MNAKELNPEGLAPASEAASGARRASDPAGRLSVEEGLVDVALATMDSPIGEPSSPSRPEASSRSRSTTTPRRCGGALGSGGIAPSDGSGSADRRGPARARRVLQEGTAPVRPALDRRLIGPFARKLSATSRVGFGELATYGEIAAASTGRTPRAPWAGRWGRTRS